MCGICGIINFNSLKKSDFNSFSRMVDSLYHRGPDGEGKFSTKKFVFGMRRLSIIDLEKGNQPLYNEDKSIVLIANGEIYNYKELTLDLKKKKHKFKTKSDCETILHAYEEFGIDCVKKLRGMFAFCLYDKNLEKIFIVRDRLGEKPLYYFKKDNCFLFSSELKSIVSSGKIKFDLELSAINDYFHFSYIPEPKTPIKDLKKLSPATIIEINLNNGIINKKKYWDILSAKVNKKDPVITLRKELSFLSKLIVRSDVPVGIALSSGLDSSALAALSSKKLNKNLIAFTVGYPNEKKIDERGVAKKFCDYLGIKFVPIEINDKFVIENFEKVVSSCDDPIADISMFGYYSVSKTAREHGIKVLIQGQGGDELFWGYNWVKLAYYLNLIKKEFLTNKRKNFSFDEYLFLLFKIDGFKLIKKLYRFSNVYSEYLRIKSLIEKNNFIFYEMSPVFSQFDKIKDNFFDDEFVPFYTNINFNVNLLEEKRTDLKLVELIYLTYLLENGLAQGDRLSMANSVELRLPFLDYKFVETAIGLKKFKSDVNLHSKFLLREVIKPFVPKFILNQPKRGFEPPVKKWLLKLCEKYVVELDNGLLVKHKIIKPNLSKYLINKNMKNDYSTQIFHLIVLEFWLRGLISV